MSQRRTGRVSQRPSFKNKTLSPPCLHLQPCLASTPPAGVHSASPPLCTARASQRLPQPPGEQQRGGDEEKPALISSLKTLLAPYLWRTFNSALPQAALPPPRSARWLRLGEESAGTELHLQLPLRLLRRESAGIRKDKWGGGVANNVFIFPSRQQNSIKNNGNSAQNQSFRWLSGLKVGFPPI